MKYDKTFHSLAKFVSFFIDAFCTIYLSGIELTSSILEADTHTNIIDLGPVYKLGCLKNTQQNKSDYLDTLGVRCRHLRRAKISLTLDHY